MEALRLDNLSLLPDCPETTAHFAIAEASGDRAEMIDQLDYPDRLSVRSNESEGSTMEPFEDYQVKIEELLDSIGFPGFSIEAIQHEYTYMNCVYALTSRENPAEQYVLRVAINGDIRESDGKHDTLENDIILLNYLRDKVPVPQVKAYSLTADNVLVAAYTIQTRIFGESLDRLWRTMAIVDKYTIVDEFLRVLVMLESVHFANAGTIVASSPLPAKMNDFPRAQSAIVRNFEPSMGISVKLKKNGDQICCSTKDLLIAHLNYWIQEEIDRGQGELISPNFRKLLLMVEVMEAEGAIRHQKPCTVLHHWDLEPRNIMVSKVSGTWKICGIIDWDDAIALPTQLSRIPPRWIWHFPDQTLDFEDGYLNDDQYVDPQLSEENKMLKAYFDEKIEMLLPGYVEDAYGSGRWMRRIWHFAKEGAFRVWQWEFLDQLPKDWEARPKPNSRNGLLQSFRAMVNRSWSVFVGRVSL